jgi:hypothetical protein
VDERLFAALTAVQQRGEPDGPALRALAGASRARVVRWRCADGPAPHELEPWAAERLGRTAAWSECADSEELRVGFDERDRPVLAERRWVTGAVALLEAWDHGSGWSEVLRPLDEGRVARTRYVLDAEGRTVAVAALEAGALRVERWRWSADGPTAGEEVTLDRDFAIAAAYVARFLPSGELERLEWGSQEIGSLTSADLRARVREGLARAREIATHEVLFDARVHAPAGASPPLDEVARLLVEALRAAVVSAVASSGVERPFVVQVVAERGRLPPVVRIGAARLRARATELIEEDAAAVALLGAASLPDGSTGELIGRLDDRALAACRALNGMLARGSREHDAARGALERLGGDLARALNGHPWQGVEAPFLALVEVGDPYGQRTGYDRAADAVGAARVDAFRASVATRPRGASAAVDAARDDRERLSELLASRGLDRHAARLAREVAVWGARLVRTPSPARSRLGGPPLLPAQASWPRTTAGRPLAFLAGIDLAELPAFSGRDVLPPAGWLLYFADTDPHDPALVDTASNTEAAAARVLHVAAGDTPRVAQPPEALHAPDSGPVRLIPQLTLPDHADIADDLALDTVEAAVYEQIAFALRRAEPGDDWVLGAVSDPQATAPDPASVLLLHVSSQSELDILDAGSLQFRIAAADARAGEWSRAYALAFTR